MKYLILAILLPSICLGEPFAGKWHVIAEVTKDNCFNELGDIVDTTIKIKQNRSVLSYKRDDGLTPKGINNGGNSFKLVVNFLEPIGTFQAPSRLTYQFKKIKNGKADFSFALGRRLEDGFSCLKLITGTAQRK